MPPRVPAESRILSRREFLFRSVGGITTLAGLGALSGCGYTVGNGFQNDVRTVNVPIFTTKTFRRYLEHQLTAAVHKQIQQRTPFRLVSEEEADTQLTGKIVDVKKTVLGKTNNDDARELNLAFIVDVTWEDLRHDKVLAHNEVAAKPDEVQFISQASFAPEIGQSLATGYQQAINRMASDIVNMMEAPW